MVLKVYAFYDELGCLYDGLLLYRTDKLASFEATRKVPAHIREHTQLCCVGSFDNETASFDVLDSSKKYIVPWQELNVDQMAEKSPISHEAPEVQITKFQEKIST